MAFGRDLASGASGFLKAFGFCWKNGLWWMFLVPVLLWVALAFGLYQAMDALVDHVGVWAAGYLEIPVDAQDQGWWADVKGWLNGARELLTALVLKLAIGYLLFVANKYIVLVVLSPLLAYASERAEEILTGKRFPFSLGQLLKDAVRGALIAIRNGFAELAISFLIWALTLLVPLISPISFVLLFAVSAYFYGFSMFDYVFERRRLRIRETTRAMNRRLGAVLANGALFSLLMKLPLIGIMLSPAMASVGAVISTVESERDR